MKRTKPTKATSNRGIKEVSGNNKINKRPRRTIELSLGAEQGTT
jgi:hypothetical protein